MAVHTTLELDYHRPAPAPEDVSIEWQGVICKTTTLKVNTPYDFNWSGESAYLAIHDIVLGDGEMSVDGLGRLRGGDLRDKMTFVPASCALSGWAEPVERANAFTAIYFQPEVLSAELEREVRESGQHPVVYFDDRSLRSTMLKLGGLLGQPGVKRSLHAETLALLAAVEMQRIIEGARPSEQPRGIRLSAGQERLVREFISSNLHHAFGLSELANLARLSRFHFARAFKGTFGEPPHQYVARLRIERSMSLLRICNLPISEIAVACGFPGVSQFTRVFRKHAGITPTHFRRTTLR